ncbi:hypothetical protein GCM10011391_05110 [Pullulanibacillus camelliae]|uniref:NAD(P)-dependent oxidoreductase n=2 Tax=Pullulanibacillus camelliae TaxID=1707096 RepID=A0A8J2VFB4_9BACL|nr:hypothetical protein GCM10011391_05110 [Pullulanibacillus camelliae]
MTTKTLAFIGLGIMGSLMAKNIQKAGYTLTVHNRTKEKAKALIADGAQWAATPKEAVAHADIVFTMLANPTVVEAIAYDKNGILPNMKKGALWVDMSTVNPSFSKKMADAARNHQLRYLDAPVSGSKVPAEKGELIFLVGGTQEDCAEAQPYFDIMGKATHFMGENGQGSAMKILINLMLAQSMAVFSETVHLGEAMGLGKENVVELLLNHPVAAPILQGKKNNILNETFEPEFPLAHMQKDLHLVAQTAFEHHYAMPLANAAKELYAQAKQHGLGNQDMSAIFQWLK